jgi:hypothetical protein
MEGTGRWESVSPTVGGTWKVGWIVPTALKVCRRGVVQTSSKTVRVVARCSKRGWGQQFYLKCSHFSSRMQKLRRKSAIPLTVWQLTVTRDRPGYRVLLPMTAPAHGSTPSQARFVDTLSEAKVPRTSCNAASWAGGVASRLVGSCPASSSLSFLRVISQLALFSSFASSQIEVIAPGPRRSLSRKSSLGVIYNIPRPYHRFLCGDFVQSDTNSCNLDMELQRSWASRGAGACDHYFWC